MAQAGHITVTNGSLCVDVPRDIFRGADCSIDPEKAAKFKELVQSKYPWVNDNSADVLLRKARLEMVRVRDEETNGRLHSKDLASKGRLEDAIKHLQIRLELNPEDADSWYALGELLCKAGRVKEGYEAINRGSSLKKSLHTER